METGPKKRFSTTERKHWIELLSSASVEDLRRARKRLDKEIDYDFIVKPESGTLMVQARADGDSARFNLGEVGVSKCVLQVLGQYMGYGMVVGNSDEHAELAALFDGLLQAPQYHDDLKKNLIKGLAKKQKQKDQASRKETAQTKVEFFTLKKSE